MRVIGLVVGVFWMTTACASAPEVSPRPSTVTPSAEKTRSTEKTPTVEETSSEEPASEELAESVILKWSTASEQECYGYHVYRGSSADGPFERLTQRVIPGGGTTNEVRHYRFEDHDILPSGIYFYFVEEVSMDGTARRLMSPRPFDV